MSAALQDARLAKFARRKFINQVALVLSLAAMAFGLFWLFWILFETIRLGIGGIAFATFTQMTPAPNEAGGLPPHTVSSRAPRDAWCIIVTRSLGAKVANPPHARRATPS